MPGSSPKGPGSSPKGPGSSPKGPSSPVSEPPPEQVIEADDDIGDSDGDSALGPDAESSTASITSSILQYRTIHGRTYHSERGNAFYWHLGNVSE
ncbi:hypothetical protein Neosp_013645 [[Neocosmospora] mangrovei]